MSALKKQLFNLVYYNKWAHAQIGAFCVKNFKNNPEVYTENMNLPFRSIRNTLCHLWFAEQLWYCRMIGGTHRNLEVARTIPRTIDLSEFATYWMDKHENEGNFESFFEEIDNETVFQALSKSGDSLIKLVEVFDEDELVGDFKYFDTANKKCVSQRNMVISHVVNHSTHHRGQISTAVLNLCKDQKPINLDLIYWLRTNEQTKRMSTLQ